METAVILEAAIALVDLGGKLYDVISKKGELTPEQVAEFRRKLDDQKARFDAIAPFTPQPNDTPATDA